MSVNRRFLKLRSIRSMLKDPIKSLNDFSGYPSPCAFDSLENKINGETEEDLTKEDEEKVSMKEGDKSAGVKEE